MRIKKILSSVLAFAMIAAVLPAIGGGLIAEAAESNYYAELYGCSGGGGNDYIQIGGTAGGGNNGTSTNAPLIVGTTTSVNKGAIGSARAGAFSFNLPAETAQNAGKVTLNMNIQGWNNAQGNAWSKLVAYETNNGTWSSSFSNTSNLPEAINNDYSVSAGYWTDKINDSTNGIVTIDVTTPVKNAANANAALENPADTVVVSLRVQIAVRGVQITCKANDETQRPYLTVKESVSATVKYVDENNTEIAEQKTVSTANGATLSMKDESIAPHVIEKDGAIYARDITNTGFTVTEESKEVTVTYTKAKEVQASQTAGMDWFAAEWTLTGPDINYSDYQVTDLSGKAFTGFVYAGATDGIYPGDRGGTGENRKENIRIGGTHWTSGTTKMRIVVQKTDGGYNVRETLFDAVDVASPYLIADLDYTGEVNGIAEASSWKRTDGNSTEFKFENAKYYTIAADTIVPVTVTYTADGTTVYTDTKTYDTAKSETVVTFPAYTYAPDGGNYIYTAAEQTLSESKTIPMTKSENPDVAGLKLGDKVTDGGKEYTITSGNLIPNGDFSNGLATWYTGDGIAAATANFTLNNDGTIKINTNGGNASKGCLYRSWKIEPGKTYLFAYSVSASGEWHNFALADKLGTDEASKTDTSSILIGTKPKDYKPVTSSDTLIKASTAEGARVIFTNTDNYQYAKIRYRWTSGVSVGNFGLYEVEENVSASASVTVKYYYDNEKTDLCKTVTKTVIKGETASFDAFEASRGGKFYKAEALSYENVTQDVEYDVVMTADASKIAPTNDFSYDFTSGETVWAGDHGYTAADKTGTISIGWGNYRQTVMTFPMSAEQGKKITSAKLTVRVGFTNNDGAPYTVYAIDPKFVGEGTMTGVTTGKEWGDRESVKSELVAVQVGSDSWIPKGKVTTIELDLSKVDIGDTLALLIESSGQAYTDSMATANPPYLTDITTVDTASYTVKYVGDDLNEADKTVSYIVGTELGYNDEKIFPNVEIPYFEGYVFTGKSVDGETVTLNYAKTSHENDFFTNVDESTRLVSLNMLGAHDAFTSKISSSESKFDAAGTAQGDAGSKNAPSSAAVAAPKSKAQSLGAYELLENGVRYFDIRLSRSNQTAKGGLLGATTVQHTNGVFYTTHGMLSEEFRPIAFTIGQWMKEHPTELVVLDFQEIYDYMSANGSDGNGNQETWKDMYKILTEAGIADLAIANSAKVKELTYGSMKGKIMMFGRLRAIEAGLNKFYRRDNAGKFDTKGIWGATKLFSYYDEDAIGSSFKADYINTQIKALDNYNSLDDPNGDHAIHHYVRVMQAQSQASNLINQASSDHTALANAIASNPTWLSALPIVMVDGVGTSTASILGTLKANNQARDVVINYTSNGEIVASATKSLMTGEIYTALAKELVGGEQKYSSMNAYTTAPSTCTAGSVTLVPSSEAIEVPVEAFNNKVYTVQKGAYYVDSNGNGNFFGVYNWGNEGTYDRIGVAILDVAKADGYKLTGTNINNQVGGSRKYGLKIYAVSEDAYSKLDLSEGGKIAASLTDADLAFETYIDNTSSKDGTSYNGDIVLKKELIDSIGTKVVLIGMSYGGLYGISAGDIAITSVSVPTLKTLLGWNDNKFTLDYMFDGSVTGDYTITVEGEGDFTASANVTVNETTKGLGFATVNTNRLYIAKASASGVEGAATEAESVYSMVIQAILDKAFGTDETINKDQLAEVNNVLAAGGIYIVDGALTAEAQKIMTLSGDTITLTDAAYAAGLRFGENMSASNDGTDVSVTVSEDGKSVSFAADLSALGVVYLEEVELVFEPEAIEEIENGGYEEVLDFTEIL